MHPSLTALLAEQAGVVSRQQALAAGLARHDVARLLRRRELTALHPGVYVDHTGTPTFLQRCWGGVLLYWPAALADETAMRVVEGPGSRRPETPVHLVVARERRLEPPTDIKVLRRDGLDEVVQWHLGPPRLRYDEAALDVAARASSDFAALGALSRAVQSRRTTALRILEAARRRPRLARRDWIESVLADVARGACSVLEHGYLTKVERPHGLGLPGRQVRDRLGAGAVYRDVRYPCGLVVELDGRLFHDTTEQRDKDLDRDLDVAAAGADTVRISYGQVFDRPCWTAVRVGRVLALHGWRGRPRPCGPECLYTDSSAA
ncbi:MAG TPA: type IV toxin-antitoxin system AbiEi family antitoxin domain-containing protein [Marmoricola sp.]|nr:type IV toxin-antitoxin system AbiEi family antitoxin domain-containing protein [Marmoricola sp.]